MWPFQLPQIFPRRATEAGHTFTGLYQTALHKIELKQFYEQFQTDPDRGLTRRVVEARQRDERNIISAPPTQYWKKVLNYVFGGFNFLMWIAFIVTMLSYKPLGEPYPNPFNLGVAILLLIVITVSTAFYAIVDWNAARVLKSIMNLINHETTVIRDGEHRKVDSNDVVLGDLVVLLAGDRVPADLRIVRASNGLEFDRSHLTGESVPVSGSNQSTSDNPCETENLAFTATFVVQGECTGVVIAVGNNSFLGHIVHMYPEKFKLSTIQTEVWFFTKVVSLIAMSCFCISMIVWAAWIKNVYPSYETASKAIIDSIGCITACVPQGLPICVALSLTIAASRLKGRKVLVKNLAIMETLGCVTVLCTDKTGTLTDGKMSVQNVAFLNCVHPTPIQPGQVEGGSRSVFEALRKIARLCNSAIFEQRSELHRIAKGNPTDAALLKFAVSLGPDDLPMTHEKLGEILFNPTRRWMLTVVRKRPAITTGTQPDTMMLLKGAPDVLFQYCSKVFAADGNIRDFDPAARQELHARQIMWSNQGMRVIALCQKQIPPSRIGPEAENMENLANLEMQNLTLVGIVGICDSPRKDVMNAIRNIKEAGVKVFMITGDFHLTAVEIARQVGLISVGPVHDLSDMRALAPTQTLRGAATAAIKPPDGGPPLALCLTGQEVDDLELEDWNVLVENYAEVVFARITPQQKLQIVNSIRCRGDNKVAVTGDGVNDAPALKASDIGIAMGSGSDVAKEAAEMILRNNDFSSIVVAIKTGRLVFDNLKKVLIYLMPAGSYTQLIAVFSNVFFGMQIPLSAYLQICFSITNDVAMSIPLMYEQPEESQGPLIERRPRNVRTDRLTDWKFFIQIYLFMGLMIWPCAMSMWFLYMSKQGLGFYDVLLVYDKWTDGYEGYSISQLTHFVSVGQCIYYVTMVFCQYGTLLAVRNRRLSILNSNPLRGPRKNLAIPLGMTVTALIAVINLYGPGLEHLFGTTPIPGMFWGLPFAFALGILIMDEIRKLIVRTRRESFIAKIAW